MYLIIYNFYLFSKYYFLIIFFFIKMKTNTKQSNILIDDSIDMKAQNKNWKNNKNENLQKNYNDNNNNFRLNNKNDKTLINTYNSKKNSKKVKIIDNIEIIDVECWKKYNLEQTADDNIEDYLEEIERNEDLNNKKPKNSNNKRTKSKTENVTCTCVLI